MSKYQLVLGDRFEGKDKGKRPLDLVIQGESLKDLKCLLSRVKVHRLRGFILRLSNAISCGSKCTSNVSDGKKLFNESIGIYSTGNVVFEGVSVGAGSTDGHLKVAFEFLDCHLSGLRF